MTLAFLILVAPPVAVFLSLCAIERGRPALYGIGLSVVALAAVWPLVADGNVMMRIITELMLGAAVAAGVAQGIRVLLPADAGRLAWPGLVALILVAGLVAFVQYLAWAGA